MVSTYRTVRHARECTQEAFLDSLMNELASRFAPWVLTPQQIGAWQTGLGWIWEACNRLPEQADGWLILPEYLPPLSSSRPDVVIATGERAFLIEQKTGDQPVGRAAQAQLERYTWEVWGSVLAARRVALHPVLMFESKKPSEGRLAAAWTQDGGEPSVLTPVQFGDVLAQAAQHDASVADLSGWTTPRYTLHPSIVEAATALIAHVEDRNVLTHVADDAELNRIRDSLLACVSRAQRESAHVLVMVTGVPGSGKTLVGLRLAHDPDLQDALPAGSGTPLYLTGNGPLVQVLVEAIARDHHSRFPEVSKTQARTWAGSKVKLVRAITADEFPVESHVVVFDEGQRIWTAEHMALKHGKDHVTSEAEAILATLEGRAWAVLVVLIGGGQEINRGEAGPSTWVDAVEARTTIDFQWSGVASPEIELPKSPLFQADPKLHLRVSRRATSAAALSEWVEDLLSGDLESAARLRSSEFPLFPLVVTRHLHEAKNWIRERVESEPLSGLRPTSGAFASSKNGRLRAYGIEVGAGARDETNWPRWFLDRKPSLHSSELLEVAASEFKCQGLELDYTLVCWSWDLAWDGQAWNTRRLDKARAKWHNLNVDAEYLLNAYRVLLTRCRRGSVIWVPLGSEDDRSRDSNAADSIYHALVEAGVTSLSQTHLAHS